MNLKDYCANTDGRRVRLFLTPEEDRALGPKFIVYFQVKKVSTLVGGPSAFPPAS